MTSDLPRIGRCPRQKTDSLRRRADVKEERRPLVVCAIPKATVNNVLQKKESSD